MEFSKDVKLKEIKRIEGNLFSLVTEEDFEVEATLVFRDSQTSRLRSRILRLIDKRIKLFDETDSLAYATLRYNVNTQTYIFSNFVVTSK